MFFVHSDKWIWNIRRKIMSTIRRYICRWVTWTVFDTGWTWYSCAEPRTWLACSRPEVRLILSVRTFITIRAFHAVLVLARTTRDYTVTATSNVICFLLCIVFTMSTCMFYNYCVCRSTVSALCALLPCSAAICQTIMSMWLSVWTNKWWWWWWQHYAVLVLARTTRDYTVTQYS